MNSGKQAVYLETSLEEIIKKMQALRNAAADDLLIHDEFFDEGDSPQIHIQDGLSAIWREVLHRPQIGVHDDLFRRGGNSLTATQILSRIQAVWGVNIPWAYLFDHPTIAELAAEIDRQLQAEEWIFMPPIQPISRDQSLPTAFSQERIWFLHQLQPDNSAYNIVVALRFTGPLDVPAYTWSLNQLIKRHESLRTVIIAADGTPAQVILPELTISPTVIDLQQLPASASAAEAVRLAAIEAARPFDLQRGPLLRVVIYRLGAEDHLAQITIHHAVFDSWSTAIFEQELMALYEARLAHQPNPLPPVRLQYADFAHWQRHWLQGEVLEKQLAFWRGELANLPVLSLPTDHPRPPVQTYRGAVCFTDEMPALFASMRELSQIQKVTPFMVSLSAFEVLLSRYSHQTDFGVGVPVANRHYLATENIIGTLVNTLVLRANLADDPTFSQLLERVRQKTLAAYAHQDLPFEKLVAEMNLTRDLSHAPLFQVMLDYINVPAPARKFAGITAEPVDIDRGGAQFDLSLTVVDSPDTQRLNIEYNTDLFNEPTMRRLLDHFLELLTVLPAHLDTPVSQIPFLLPAERETLLFDWNKTQADYPATSPIHHLVERQAQLTPASSAIIFGDETLSYRDLNHQAETLARYLRLAGVQPGTFVGISMHRSPQMVVGLLAILKAGAAYLPLDPAFPKNRLAYMLADTGAPLVITEASLAGWLAEEVAPAGVRLISLDGQWPEIVNMVEARPDLALPAVSADNLAYIIYTSGSTGNPKGVQISHRNAVNFLAAMQQEPGLTAADTLLAVTTLSFDISVLEIFLPLITGASVALVSKETTFDGLRLAQQLALTRATVMQATPTTWRLMLEAGWPGSPGLKALCGGEPLPPELARQLLSRVGQLWNMYGPTETTVWSTISRVTAAEQITIGRPIANTTLYILDRHLQPAPVGVVGELYIGGHGVSQGYLNRAELTREKFITNPFAADGSRMYRTGDLARYRFNGQIEFLGRADHQIKIRGFRIELGEIETALTQYPGIRQTVVIPLETQQLAAYLIADEATEADALPSAADLRSFLLERLPDYMVPAYYTFLPVFPLTPNNKIDRNALPRPDLSRPQLARDFVAPRSRLETELAAMWEELLQVSPIGVHDNFFELGGHSLMAFRLFERIKTTCHANLPLASLFQGATIEELAKAIGQEQQAGAWSPLVAIEAAGDNLPFFCVHGITGDVLWFRELARQLAPHQPFYGIQARGLDGAQTPLDSIEQMARQYITEIRAVQPVGPYFLGGASFGGTVALEMAQQLTAQGDQVSLLAIFDHFPPHSVRAAQARSAEQTLRATVKAVGNLPRWLYNTFQLDFRTITGRVRRKGLVFFKEAGQKLQPWRHHNDQVKTEDLIDYGAELPTYRKNMIEAHYQAVETYQPRPYSGRVLLLRATSRPLFDPADPEIEWRYLVSSEQLTVRDIPGSHERMFVEPNVRALAEALKTGIELSR